MITFTLEDLKKTMSEDEYKVFISKVSLTQDEHEFFMNASHVSEISYRYASMIENLEDHRKKKIFHLIASEWEKHLAVAYKRPCKNEYLTDSFI